MKTKRLFAGQEYHGAGLFPIAPSMKSMPGFANRLFSNCKSTASLSIIWRDCAPERLAAPGVAGCAWGRTKPSI